MPGDLTALRRDERPPAHWPPARRSATQRRRSARDGEVAGRGAGLQAQGADRLANAAPGSVFDDGKSAEPCPPWSASWAARRPSDRRASVCKLIGIDHGCHWSGAGNDREFRSCIEGYRSAIPLHVWPVLHAEREVNAQMRVLFCEVLHALVLGLGPSPSTHVDRPSKEVA